MLRDHLNILTLFAMSGEIVGRKKLQKMVYIAKQMGYPFNERYHFHRYGPYSDELTVRLEELCNLGFLIESEEDKGHYSQYRYTLSPQGQAFLEMYHPPVVGYKDLCQSLNSQSARFLELLSTILYFSDLEEGARREKIRQLKKKQNYSDDDFDEAHTYLQKLAQVVASA
ncbi:YwgA family protein [Shouchella clausii]|uniref:YwgA family protein n=1 Tax=Shouchella TaxID=2893057 RepID=UPI0004E61EAE|nr:MULTISPECIES: hypothetical protein [Shouchella]ALA53117.1 hypothetical protein DB29_02289 [Shouchella clausii]MBU3231336.1 YwgA family protein [Shouchella clausii]MBU3263661.1 YwgA family protein [Shouchella clausii]MBU3508052.1 YwgA family protein [Shouchella clausii]MBU3536647.1 YwgA family protein [Shouchella clausii]